MRWQRVLDEYGEVQSEMSAAYDGDDEERRSRRIAIGTFVARGQSEIRFRFGLSELR